MMISIWKQTLCSMVCTKIYIGLGIQMKQKEVTETSMMIEKTLWSPWLLQIYFSALRVERGSGKQDR